MLTTNIRALKSVSEAGAELLGRREMRRLKARVQAEYDMQRVLGPGEDRYIGQSYGVDHRQNFVIAAGAR